MIQVMFATSQDVARAKKKLLTLHEMFENSSEREATIDFENCLGKRLKSGTAIDFLIACENAADDMLSPKKVPETYDLFTIGRFKDMADIFAKELFGRSFSEEVRQFMDVRDLVISRA